MIKFQNVSKIYHPNTVAANDVSFQVQEKEFACLVGKSGAGKTTLLKLLIAEEKPTRGSIFFEGQDIGQFSARDLSLFRRKIGVVFQDYKLLSSKTTFENVAYIMEVMGASEEDIGRDVPKVLELTGLAERTGNFPEELSGGEKQRAAIARALIHRPKIILADEPTGNLDPYQTRDIIKLLIKINEGGTTVILATHNKDIVNSIGKRVITMEDGRIVRDEKEGRFIL